MTQKIEIPVSATLNTTGVEQGAKKLDDTMKRVGKHRIDPVPDGALRKVEALFQAYLKLDREMARRLKVTGQQGMTPDSINWDPVYQNPKSRANKLRQLQSYMQSGGADFQPPNHGGGGGRGAGMAAGIAQAGLRAAGPAGGVAANALGTGMSAGFGAGLMGLVGGMAALGVGKLVGAITENIERAENNNIAFDRLKRTVGDVGTSFLALKTAVMKTGEGLNLQYDETTSLFSQFAKAGNVSGRGYQALPQEIGLGVGLSRSYGLDPGQGVGLLGQMRGVGVTKDVQDSRRLALLIGETIAKSDAFAKADEVFDAIANFATAQTRQSMSAANVAGYAGMFSSMVGSGISGMDPSGAASMLSRVNSSLAGGGARGEASQFFTSMVGNRMGLDPLQMQVLREGGAFATKDQMFGVGSAYTRYMGQTGPTGSSNFLGETRALIEEKYAGDSEQQKLMRAQAFGNHTGLNMNQAMAMLSLQPNQMGELQKVLGNKAMSLNASGINNAAMALNGTDEQRAAIRAGLLKRDDLSKDDRSTLEGLGSRDPEEQKRTLAVLSAQYEQERTQGSDIRDSRAALDNIKVKIADYAVPALQDMRKILANIASGGKKTVGGVMKEINEAEEKERVDGINQQFDSKVSGLKSERDKLIGKKSELWMQRVTGKITPDEYNKQVMAIDAQIGELGKDIKRVDSERGAALKAPSADAPGSGRVGAGPGATASGLSDFKDPEQRKNLKTMLDVLGQSEGAGYNSLVGQGKFNNEITDLSQHPNKVGLRTADGPSTAAGRYQITGTTWRGLQKKLGLTDFSPESQDKAAIELLRQRGALDDVLKGDFDAAAKKLGNEWQSLPSGASPNQGKHSWDTYHKQVEEAKRRNSTPVPEGAKAAASEAGPGRGAAVSFEPLIVKHSGSDGRQVAPDQTLQPRVQPANPVMGGATGSY